MNLQGRYTKNTQALKGLFFGSHPLSLLGHPYAINRTGLKQAIKELSGLTKPGATLDVGCGVMPYRDLFKLNSPYEGIEIETRHKKSNQLATYFYNGKTLPVEDGQYSSVLCFQVLEHCSDPCLMLKECHRVLNEGGTLLLTMPLMWPEHEQPWDFQRFTTYGITKIIEESGFRVKKITKINPGIACLIQINIDWLDSLHRRLSRRIRSRIARILLLLTWRILMTPFYTAGNLVAATARSITRNLFNPFNQRLGIYSSDADTEVFLDLAVLAIKQDPVGNRPD